MKDSIMSGNATTECGDHRGWILGYFMDHGDPRHSDQVEIKWGVHKHREEHLWSDGKAWTITILIMGKLSVEFPNSVITLVREGDYVLFGPDVKHRWFAEKDTLTITVRWPSKP